MNPNTLYVQNPNYSPLDANSNRYVTDAQAAQQASQKAAGLNDIFTPFNLMNKGTIKTYTPDNFYTPLTPQVPAGVTQVQQPVARAAAPVAAQAPRAAVANPNVIPERVAFSPTGAAPVAAPTATAQPAAPQSATQDITALAQQAGQAGMSLDAYMGLLEKGNTPTLSQNDAIRTKLGIPNLVDEAFKKPDTTQVDRYRSLYGDAGLGSVKEKIAELDASIAKKRQDLNAATGEVNSNPWISQGTRQGRLKNLQELAFADINNDIDSKNAYLQQYNDGVGQIEKMLSLESTDQQANRQLTVDKLNYLLNEAERQAGGIQQDNITAGLRSVPEFLKGVLNRESTAAQRDIDKVLASKTGTRVGGGSGIAGVGGRAISTGTLSARAQAVLEAPELLSNYTPTERGKIVDELVAAGADVTSIAAPKLAAAQREQISQYDDLVRQADMAGTILTDLKLNTGILASRRQAVSAMFGGAKDFTEYRSVVDNMGSTLLKMRSGAAVTPQEFERLRGFIPQINDDEATAATKIQAFYTELDTARQNYILRQTQTTNQIKKGTGQSTSTVSDQEVDTFLQSKGY